MLRPSTPCLQNEEGYYITTIIYTSEINRFNHISVVAFHQITLLDLASSPSRTRFDHRFPCLKPSGVVSRTSMLRIIVAIIADTPTTSKIDTIE